MASNRAPAAHGSRTQTPIDASEIRKLESDLTALKEHVNRREFEMAELIDEIVYAENESAAASSKLAVAEADVATLYACLDNLLSYTNRLERDILAPALGDLAATLRTKEEAQKARQNALSTIDRAPTAFRSQIFQKLFDTLKGPAPSVAESLAKRQDAVSNAQRGGAYDTEDAFVIADGLIGAKSQLQALLLDSAKRIKKLSVGAGSSPSLNDKTDGNVILESELSSVKRELQDANEQLVKARGERDALARKVAEGFQTQGSVASTPQFAELQAQWHSERAALQQRIRVLEEAAEATRRDRIDVEQRLETLHEALNQSQQERTLIEDELRRERQERLTALSQLQRRDNQPFNRMERFGGEAEHDLRMELDRVVREHSAQVTQLQSEIATLRVEAQTAKRDRAFDDAQTQQLEQLRRNNEALRRDIARLQQQVTTNSRTRAPTPGGDDGSLALEAKVRSFESTITQLNDELGQVDRRIAEVEQQHQEEKRRLVAAFDAERRQYQLEREECDALVLKMSHEIEFLVRENAFRQGSK